LGLNYIFGHVFAGSVPPIPGFAGALFPIRPIAEECLFDNSLMNNVLQYIGIDSFTSSLSDTSIMKPIVALIGRPNVGKSTLFNRITRTQNALVDNLPGVTRDRHFGNAVWNDIEFTLVDTGGFINNDEDTFAVQIRRQVHQALEDADTVVLVLDGKYGVSPFDTDLVTILREVGKPVFYVVNKIDSIEQEVHLSEMYSLGIESLFPVSAEHGYGLPDFLDTMVRSFPPTVETDAPSTAVKLAVVGRPNVGKSSLINRILGENRLLVSDIPGTTRDSIDTTAEIDGCHYLLIDTAGIRRKSKVSRKLEKFSIIKALKSLDQCDVALIVIDAFEGITEQDINIAGYACDRGCGCIFVLNKWDIVEKDQKTTKRYYESLRSAAKFLSFAPIVTISAKTGKRVPAIFKLVQDVFCQYSRRISTGQLNKIFEEAIEKNEPSLHKGRRIKFYYSTQVSTQPPAFVCFVNYPDAIHFSYKRYLINQLRTHTGLENTPIHLMFRQRSGRRNYGKKKRNSLNRR